MASCNLAVVIQNPKSDFLLIKQSPPPSLGEQEYDSHLDSNLYDLPSTQLQLLEGAGESPLAVSIQGAADSTFDFTRFDLESAFDLVLGELGFGSGEVGDWRFLKHVEEPEFGPGPPVRTIFVSGKLSVADQNLRGAADCKWFSTQACLNYLLEVKPGGDRVGLLAVLGLVNDSSQSVKREIPASLHYQEYPPGVMLVPMRSRTLKPFTTTNLVIFAPENVSVDHTDSEFVAHGDALIVDPGCHHELHGELRNIIAALPRKLVVFVTHHHRDHIDGLQTVQECNTNALLLAHEKTRHRIGKDGWSLGYIPISGGENIYVGGQRLTVIFAPGHTDGHMALLHVSTHSLIVGDHCVGQGSASLDFNSGGYMADYFQSTYKFLELSPHVLIPMHGRINLWPKHMLCGYLKNRRSREASILKAIESGAQTLFDIVADVYSGVDCKFWFPAASNVRLHIDHLAQQDKLPKEFSIPKFRATCGLHFVSRWMLAYLGSRFPIKYHKPGLAKLLIAGVVAGCSVLYLVKQRR